MPRTQKEIVARYKARSSDDFFGFETNEYLAALDFEYAKEFLKPEITKEEWCKSQQQKSPREQMIEYMEFAWNKANNRRGISASRSISHYVAWLWLEGVVDWGDEMLDDYEYYGKPQLVKICEHLGLDSVKWDDGIRTNTSS